MIAASQSTRTRMSSSETIDARLQGVVARRGTAGGVITAVVGPGGRVIGGSTGREEGTTGQELVRLRPWEGYDEDFFYCLSGVE